MVHSCQAPTRRSGTLLLNGAPLPTHTWGCLALLLVDIPRSRRWQLAAGELQPRPRTPTPSCRPPLASSRGSTKTTWKTKMLAHVRASAAVPVLSRRPAAYTAPAGGMAPVQLRSGRGRGSSSSSYASTPHTHTHTHTHTCFHSYTYIYTHTHFKCASVVIVTPLAAADWTPRALTYSDETTAGSFFGMMYFLGMKLWILPSTSLCPRSNPRRQHRPAISAARGESLISR
eukprot:COSAG06_NODE_352_length_16924_cov_168.566615_4_plen_230_part_00